MSLFSSLSNRSICLFLVDPFLEAPRSIRKSYAFSHHRGAVNHGSVLTHDDGATSALFQHREPLPTRAARKLRSSNQKNIPIPSRVFAGLPLGSQAPAIRQVPSAPRVTATPECPLWSVRHNLAGAHCSRRILALLDQLLCAVLSSPMPLQVEVFASQQETKQLRVRESEPQPP